MGGPYSCWVHSVRAWTDMDSDPVCFDIKSGTNSKDDRIVKIDHGEILCNYRVKVVREIAPSFSRYARRNENFVLVVLVKQRF